MTASIVLRNYRIRERIRPAKVKLKRRSKKDYRKSTKILDSPGGEGEGEAAALDKQI